MQMFISDKREELEKEKEKNNALRYEKFVYNSLFVFMPFGMLFLENKKV